MSLNIRVPLRRLRHSPAFTAAAVLILALGIGANVAVFTLVNAVLLRPLPFGDPDRLVTLSESNLETGSDRVGVLPGSFLDWRERSHGLEAISMFWTAPVLVTNRQEPARIIATTVSPNFFKLLSARPVIGRTFPTTDATLAGHEREIVISYALWQQWFGGDVGVLGRTLEVQGRVPLTIVGVMPPDFRFPREAQFWKSEVWERSYGRGEADRWRQAVGRLRAGVSIEAAERELKHIEAQLGREFASTNAGWTATVDPLAETVNGDVRVPLWALFAAVSLVFLLACINVATLVLQRGLGRQQELATSVALGASARRLVCESLVEYGALGVGGLIAGVLLAFVILQQLVALAPPEIPRLGNITIDLRMAVYLSVIALASIVLTGALPVLRSLRIDASVALRRGATARVTGRSWRYLVAAELAVAVVLLGSAGLMIRTMVTLQRLDIGFDPSEVVAADVMLPLSRITAEQSLRPQWDRLVLFYGEVVESVEAMPGVERAALVAAPALAGRDAMWLARAGIVPPHPDASPAWRSIQRRAVTPDYFEVLRLPLLRGRAFSDQDQALDFLGSGTGRRTGVAIVNESAARLFWPGEDPLGKSLTIGGESRVDGRIVVGVSGDARDLAPDRQPQPVVYVPFAESPDLNATLLARHGASGPPLSVSDLRARLRTKDPLLTIGQIGPFADRYADTIAPRRFITIVLTIFACFGLLLAAVGLYGLIAASVAQRRPEFALRVALGATPLRIQAMVLHEAALIVGVGITIGALGAWAGTRLLRAQLFGVEALDPATWIGTVVILGATGLAAAWFPARRASRSDPGSMLRVN